MRKRRCGRSIVEGRHARIPVGPGVRGSGLAVSQGLGPNPESPAPNPGVRPPDRALRLRETSAAVGRTDRATRRSRHASRTEAAAPRPDPPRGRGCRIGPASAGRGHARGDGPDRAVRRRPDLRTVSSRREDDRRGRSQSRDHLWGTQVAKMNLATGETVPEFRKRVVPATQAFLSVIRQDSGSRACRGLPDGFLPPGPMWGACPLGGAGTRRFQGRDREPCSSSRATAAARLATSSTPRPAPGSYPGTP